VLIVLGITASGLLSACNLNREPHAETAMTKYPTQYDLASARADCLNEKGWDVELSENGEISISLPEAQTRLYREDDTQCLKDVGIDENRSLTEKEWDDTYDAYLAGAECLIEAGWPITSPPSVEVFRGTYDTDPWLPWVEVPEDQMATAFRKCPMPDPIY
jgi:hypothetical protein